MESEKLNLEGAKKLIIQKFSLEYKSKIKLSEDHDTFQTTSFFIVGMLPDSSMVNMIVYVDRCTKEIVRIPSIGTGSFKDNVKEFIATRHLLTPELDQLIEERFAEKKIDFRIGHPDFEPFFEKLNVVAQKEIEDKNWFEILRFLKEFSATKVQAAWILYTYFDEFEDRKEIEVNDVVSATGLWEAFTVEDAIEDVRYLEDVVDRNKS